VTCGSTPSYWAQIARSGLAVLALVAQNERRSQPPQALDAALR
jgi:hypothetical protein